MNRRHSLFILGGSLIAPRPARAEGIGWQPRYVLSSAMYGDLPLASVLPEGGTAKRNLLSRWKIVGRGRITHDETLIPYHSITAPASWVSV